MIIVVKRGIMMKQVMKALNIATNSYIENKNIYYLPFPNNAHQIRYVQELTNVLKTYFS